MTLDDFEWMNGRFRITISSDMATFSLFTQKYVANNQQYTTMDTINHE